MKTTVILLAIILFTACSSKDQQAEDQAGTATETISGDIIGSDMGYIVNDATIAEGSSTAAVSIKGALNIAKGTRQVLIIRTQTETGGFTEMLALEFPAFAPGTSVDYSAEGGDAGFWIFGVANEEEIIRRTGMIAGSIRLVKQEKAENSLGLSREVMSVVGEIEVVVTDIEQEGLPVQPEKKYAARFRLPMISLDELARINQPI